MTGLIAFLGTTAGLVTSIITIIGAFGALGVFIKKWLKKIFKEQFEGLEKLYQDYQQQGLLVLGFPCNQFAQQDPASNEEIGSFCQRNYGVSFPMFAKVDVNGPTAHPLYQYLTTEAKGILGSQSIKWNFTKFLINQKGQVVKRYAPIVKPEKIAKDIQRLLT